MKSVLIFNEDSNNPEITQILDDSGYEVTVVDNSRRSIRKLNECTFDVIIISQSTTSESWTLCKKIRALTDKPLIVISPNSTVGTCIRTIIAGADYCLRKPFGPEELIARIGALLYRQSQNQKKKKYERSVNSFNNK